jgi:hypothetical protein
LRNLDSLSEKVEKVSQTKSIDTFIKDTTRVLDSHDVLMTPSDLVEESSLREIFARYLIILFLLALILKIEYPLEVSY